MVRRLGREIGFSASGIVRHCSSIIAKAAIGDCSATDAISTTLTGAGLAPPLPVPN
jgi:hypothetical protein